MRNIVIVDPASTGINFIQDVINRNYNPIGLELNVIDDEEHMEYKKMVNACIASIDADFEMIQEKDTYEETLEMIREYDPLLVIPAAERGVRIATKLANDLGLKCNPIENLDAITYKDKMQEKIAESGLRHIRGRVVKSVEEAIEYYDESGFSEVVVKPIYSAGSVGVRICLNKEEMINSLNYLFNEINMYGDKITEMVVQERINGEEYFVNTVSCDGNHRVTLMWKYTKVKTAEGGHIYDSIDTVNELGLGEAEIVEYAYDVADALGIKYGAVHGEYMVDEKGPVLIEVNCRPSGGNMDAEYLDRISGQHETDSILDAYLNPENFFYERDRGYKLYAHGSLKLFIVPKDILAESSPMKYISNRLKSHYKTSQDMIDDRKLFVKTQDFETTGGTVYLVHEDGYVLQQDLNFLRSIERYAFDLVLSEGSDKKITIDENKALDDVYSTLDRVKALGSTLFVTEQVLDIENVLQVSPDDIDDVKGEFNCVVVNLNKSLLDLKDDLIAYLFLRIIDKVKVGGLIFIPESTYQCIPRGRIGTEALIKVLDLKLELPLHNLKRMVIASKR
ncbi:hypothetical protein TL18_04320 [Methanobrevibacter sp. YE315]|uniref:ATP-grasp domain-containing protein n=1 Tax=Methanobrevibacter sp. YE315 TaxID=1609968 RepID=UPI000764E083|nr:ATP-grasp domain-containing protein [Methanobrevibacter sp. YE315]AMD17315.1 hypothetical protein TL18_04320 [Methanobrevibacter sp. YE315]